MIIYMTDDQAKALGSYLRAYKREMSRLDDDRDIDWSELAEKLDMDGGLLRKLAKGQRTGMNEVTLNKLVLGFGPRVLELVGIPYKSEPLFGLKDIPPE